jgi:hypothetical protein
MVELDSVLSVAAFPVRHGFSTVALGSMGLTGAADPHAVIRRRRQLAEQVGFDLDRALMTVQEHGANVATFHRGRPEGGQCVFSTDALATDVPGQAIVTYHADCFPLLFVDTSRGLARDAGRGGDQNRAVAAGRLRLLAWPTRGPHRARDLRTLLPGRRRHRAAVFCALRPGGSVPRSGPRRRPARPGGPTSTPARRRRHRPGPNHKCRLVHSRRGPLVFASRWPDRPFPVGDRCTVTDA